MLADTETPTALPDMKVSVRQVFGIDSDLEVPAFSQPEEHVPGPRSGLPVRSGDHARDPGGLRAQPPRHDHGLSRHRQVDPYRAGRGAPQLALRAHQPRQPRVAHRPRRQGRDRAEGRQAGHRVPGRHPALGPAEQHRAGVRRVRCRPPRRDVRDPAGARAVRPADAARPAAGDQAAPRASACSRPPTRSASATPRASITARSRSTRARWTAGRS